MPWQSGFGIRCYLSGVMGRGGEGREKFEWRSRMLRQLDLNLGLGEKVWAGNGNLLYRAMEMKERSRKKSIKTPFSCERAVCKKQSIVL